MKATLLLVSTLCSLTWSGPCFAAENPPIEAVYQRAEGFPKLILGLKFREVKTGRVFVYSPKDKGAAEEGALFYEPVFSPSGTWMFLPTGEFEGFVFSRRGGGGTG